MERTKMDPKVANDEIVYIPKQPEPIPESASQSALRNLSRTGMRGVEAVYGLPGDIAQGLLSLANLGIEKGTGYPSPLPSSLPIPTSQQVRETLQKAPEHLNPEAKEKFNKKFEEVSKPRNEAEEFSDAFISDLLPLTLSGVSLPKSIAVSGAGNLGSWAAKKVGASEGWQQGAKIGSMLLASVNAPKIKQHMDSLYTKAEQAIPAGAQVNAKILEPRLDKLKKLVETGIETPAKKEISSVLNQLDSKIVNGKIPLSEAWQIKKDLNDILYSGAPAKGLEKQLPPLVTDFNKLLQQSSKESPEFVKYLREADDIYRGLNQSSYIRSQLNKYAILDKGTYALGYGLATGNLPVVAKAVAGTAVAKGAANFIEPFARSAAIRRRYYDVVNAALKNKIPTAVKNIKLLDKEMKKELSKESPEEDEIVFIPQ